LALVACTASRGSLTPRNWNSALFIASGMTGWFWLLLGVRIGGQNDDSLNRSLVSPAGDGWSTASQRRRYPKAGITAIGLAARNRKFVRLIDCGSAAKCNSDQREFSESRPATRCRLSRWGVEKSHQRSTMGTNGRPRHAGEVFGRSCGWRTGNRGSCGAAIGNRE
jgi:hypothetical protein